MALWSNEDKDTGIPKYLTPEQIPFAVLLDATEAKDPANIAKGLTGAGWWLYRETKDSAGNIRHRAEHLVAMRSPITDSNTGPRAAVEATIAQVTNAVLSFTTKPSNQSVSAPAPATFTSVVAVSPTGGTITYQWLKQDPTTKIYANLADAGVFTGSTTNTLVISDSTGLNGSVYKVMAMAPNAVDITSVSVKLTVA